MTPKRELLSLFVVAGFCELIHSPSMFPCLRRCILYMFCHSGENQIPLHDIFLAAAKAKYKFDESDGGLSSDSDSSPQTVATIAKEKSPEPNLDLSSSLNLTPDKTTTQKAAAASPKKTTTAAAAAKKSTATEDGESSPLSFVL